MTTCALVGNDRLNRRGDACLIAGRAGTDEGDEEVTTSHIEMNLALQRVRRNISTASKRIANNSGPTVIFLRNPYVFSPPRPRAASPPRLQPSGASVRRWASHSTGKRLIRLPS